MLRHLELRDFKAWSVADIQLAPITGLFGTNSSGKTSLIQFLLLLKLTKEASDRALALDLGGPQKLMNLGTFRDVVHRHDVNRSISWTLDWQTDQPLVVSDPEASRQEVLFSNDEMGLTSEVGLSNKLMRTRYIEYRLGKEKFSLRPKTTEKAQFDLAYTGDAPFKFKRTTGRVWTLPGPIKSYAFPDQARTYYQNAGFLSDLEAAYEAQIDAIHYLGPLRESPKREYPWGRARPSDVGPRGGQAIEAILAATIDNEKRNLRPKTHRLPFQEMIAHWLRELGLIHKFRVEEIGDGSNLWQAKLQVAPKGPEVLLTDVGFGVSQILPVVTLLYYVPEGSTVILEQPEIHLHPLAQAALADLVIAVAMHRRVQVIVESHSEHFLLRLQTRIAEQVLRPEDAALYFCYGDQGESKLERLKVDLFGNIQNWPENFFGNALGEATAAELARLKRQKFIA
jgi:predicted ATPase